MRMVVGISTVLGVTGVVAAFGLFYLGEREFHLDRAHIQTLDILRAICGGPFDDFSYAHARPVLVHFAFADSAGSRVQHPSGGDPHRGLWVVHDAIGFGIGR